MKKLILILILILLLVTTNFQVYANIFSEQECSFVGVSLLTGSHSVANFIDDTNCIKKIDTDDLESLYQILCKPFNFHIPSQTCLK